jgi:hypothetical protein
MRCAHGAGDRGRPLARRDGPIAASDRRRLRDPYNTLAKWLRGELPRYAHHGASGCEACGHPVRHRDELPGAAYAYLLGLYLGDGHVAPFPRTTCLRIYLDAAYPGIVGECVRAMRRVMPANRVNALRRPPANCVVVSSYSQAWPCLLPQHGPGAKHARRIALEAWQRAITAAHAGSLVRGLIHSDGSRFTNPVTRRGRRYHYPRYFFANASQDISAIFCEHLDLLEIEWRPAGSRNISIARRASVARLDEFVGPKR